jgi:hypothetical protein
MAYTIGSEEFSTKDAVTARCREIRDRTPDGVFVPSADFAFLVSLFKFHDEWHDKAESGVEAITTHTNEHGKKKRGFQLLRKQARPREMDISFVYTIKLVPTAQSAKLTPQRLLDFKAAARTTVQDQVRAFRDEKLLESKPCPLNNTVLNRDNCNVHYPPPETFESLLLNFSVQHGINPLRVAVDSCGGGVAKFHDVDLNDAWAEYHRQHATLQLVSEEGRRGLSRFPTDWSAVIR